VLPFGQTPKRNARVVLPQYLNSDRKANKIRVLAIDPALERPRNKRRLKFELVTTGETMQAYFQSSLAARNPLQSKDCPTLSSKSQVQNPSTEQTGAVMTTENKTERPTSELFPALTMLEGAGIAHDNGNLLAALGLYCDLLARPGVLQPEHQHYVSELRLLAERSGQLMRSLLIQLSSMTGNAPEKHLESPAPLAICTDPAAILREIAPLLTAIASPSATVSVKVPRSLPSLAFPSENLERIVVNLIRNAAQAIEFANSSDRAFEARQPGRIRVALTTVAGHLHLTVEDNGPGMPVATAAAFLSPSNLPQGAQRGLGHHIVHQLVISSGGTLAVRVRPGQGTTFCIKWPVQDASRPTGQRSSARRSIGVAA
jgi:light-regulated signal transduction histidine kinase (bacteriophytochrome)